MLHLLLIPPHLRTLHHRLRAPKPTNTDRRIRPSFIPTHRWAKVRRGHRASERVNGGRTSQFGVSTVAQFFDGVVDVNAAAEGNEVDLFEHCDVHFEEDVAGDFVFCAREEAKLVPGNL